MAASVTMVGVSARQLALAFSATAMGALTCREVDNVGVGSVPPAPACLACKDSCGYDCKRNGRSLHEPWELAGCG